MDAGYRLMLHTYRGIMYVQIHIKTHLFPSSVLVLGRSRSNNIPIIISTGNTQILVSKYHSPIKETKGP